MPHPRINMEANSPAAANPTRPAAELGYHMPAEWTPLERVWLTPPHNPETWPGDSFAKAQEQFAHFEQALQEVVEVGTTTGLDIPTNDSWIRDYGPIFVLRADRPGFKPAPERDSRWKTIGSTPESDTAPPSCGPGVKPLGVGATTEPAAGQDWAAHAWPRKALHDFAFNGWGGKYETRELDDVVPQHIAAHLRLPVWVHEMVLEGGSIDVNGKGTLMTTRQCLLNPNRNPGLGQAQIEAALHQALGTRHVIWLPGGIVGDDTDGHIDDIARFVAPRTLVCIRAPLGHYDHDVLERNWQTLKAATDQDGCKLQLFALPVPDLIWYDFPPDRFGSGGRRPVPASYANFLIANKHVFVPVFGQRNDEAALRTLERAMPGFKLVPLPAQWLVVGLGAFHCLSQQEPL